MKSRALLLLFTATLLSSGAPPSLAFEDLQGELTAIEKSLWEAWKNHDAKPFEKYLAEGRINVSSAGISSDKAAQIKEIAGSDCQVRSYSFSDWAVRRLGRDAALLVYKASVDAICGGEKIPAQAYVSSIYVKDGGQWRNACYHETAAGE